MRKAIINGVLIFVIAFTLGSAGVTFRMWQYWVVMCGALALELNNLVGD